MVLAVEVMTDPGLVKVAHEYMTLEGRILLVSALAFVGVLFGWNVGG